MIGDLENARCPDCRRLDAHCKCDWPMPARTAASYCAGRHHHDAHWWSDGQAIRWCNGRGAHD